MTIKQQGGIFGRNPSFNEVEVKDISVTRSLANGENADVLIGSAGRDDVLATISVARESTSTRVGWIFKTTAGAGNLATAFSATSDGNLAFPSGQGIDFSATSGTGTSELFNDYEEGDFSPSFVASGVTITHDIQLGRYVKIGDMVTVWINLGTDAVSGTAADLTISGLPYTAESGYSGGIAIGLNYSFSSPVQQLRFASSGTTIDIYQNNSATRQTSAILGTGTNSNRLQFTGSYRAA